MLPTLITVMSMLSAATHLDLTLAHVIPDFQGMAKAAMVSYFRNSLSCCVSLAEKYNLDGTTAK